MFPHGRIALVVVLLGVAAATARSEPIEINPFTDSGLSMKWDLSPKEGIDGWNLAYDVLACKVKGGQIAEAVFKARKWVEFELHFKIAPKFRGAKVLIVPLEGERVEIELKRTWVNRKEPWTAMVLDVKGGKAILTSMGKKRGEWDVPAGKKKIGFFLKKGGSAEFKRIRIVWDPPVEPKAELEAGFSDMLAPKVFENNFQIGKSNDGKSIDGEWEVKDGVLHGKNPEQRMTQKTTIRISNFALNDYEVRFRVKTGAKEFRFFPYLGPSGQKAWLLDGYLTGEGAWQKFVIKREGDRLRVNVNGMDVIQGEKGPTGSTKIAFHLAPLGRLQLRDFHVKAPGFRVSGSGGQRPQQGGKQAGGAAAGGDGKVGAGSDLFDGTSLSNWAQHPKKGVWKAANNAIFASNQSGRQASLIYRMGRVTDFTFTFEVEAGAKGLQVLAKYNPDTTKGSLMEIPAAILTKDWNVCEVIVKGTQGRLLVNGKQVSAGTVFEGNLMFGFVLRSGGICRISKLKMGPPK